VQLAVGFFFLSNMFPIFLKLEGKRCLARPSAGECDDGHLHAGARFRRVTNEYSSWVEELGKARDLLNTHHLDTEARRKLLHEMASSEAFSSRHSRRGEN
jgi:hypothetical protein